MNIAIDLNGGDFSPIEVIEGIRIAIKRGYVLPEQILAFGNQEAIDIVGKIKDQSLQRINLRYALKLLV